MKYIFLIIIALIPFAANAQEENPYIDFRVNTYKIQEKYLQCVSDHQQKIMHDLEDKLIQQQWQTTSIAIMVFIMVGVGLLLSYLQFTRDGKSDSKSSVSLKIGHGSVEINSSVIGLAILALSFWFFQTYIYHVYNVSVFNIPAIDMTTFGVNR